MPRGKGKPRSLRTLVPGVLDDLGLDSVAAVVRIAERWSDAVGPEVARHCQPVALRRGVLEATVDTSVWCQQLQLQRDDILAALRREFGDEAPAELRLRVG